MRLVVKLDWIISNMTIELVAYPSVISKEAAYFCLKGVSIIGLVKVKASQTFFWDPDSKSRLLTTAPANL